MKAVAGIHLAGAGVTAANANQVKVTVTPLQGHLAKSTRTIFAKEPQLCIWWHGPLCIVTTCTRAVSVHGDYPCSLSIEGDNEEEIRLATGSIHTTQAMVIAPGEETVAGAATGAFLTVQVFGYVDFGHCEARRYPIARHAADVEHASTGTGLSSFAAHIIARSPLIVQGNPSAVTGLCSRTACTSKA